MKPFHHLIAAWLCLFSVSLFADTSNKDGATIASASTVIDGVSVASLDGVTVATAGGGPTLLLDETFEGPGVVATWGVGTWASDQYATSPAPLAGSYSGRKTSASFVYHDLGSLYTTLYGKFVVNGAVINNNDSNFVMRLYDTSGTANGDVAAYIRHNAGSVKQFMRWESNHGYTVGAGTNQSAATNSGLEATTYWIWWEWIASTGAGDGVFRVWYHTSDVYASRTLVGSGTTDGNRTDGVQRIAFAAGGTSADWIFDNIQIAETEIQ